MIFLFFRPLICKQSCFYGFLLTFSYIANAVRDKSSKKTDKRSLALRVFASRRPFARIYTKNEHVSQPPVI